MRRNKRSGRNDVLWSFLNDDWGRSLDDSWSNSFDNNMFWLWLFDDWIDNVVRLWVHIV